MIYKLSKKNCTGFDTVFSTKLSNFDINKFQKDFPPPKGVKQKKAFEEGKISFRRAFIIKEEKTDYHVHCSLKIQTKRKNKYLYINLDFIKGGKPLKSKSGKKTKPPKYYWNDFFEWIKKYIGDLSKVDSDSTVEHVFSRKKYSPSFTLPFSIAFSDSKEEIGDLSVDGMFFSTKHSKVGIKEILVNIVDNDIHVTINRVSKKIDENYFDDVLNLTSTFTKLFIKKI